MVGSSVSAEEQLRQAAFAVADHYLQTVKQWKPAEYGLEIVRVEGDPEAPVVILDGVHAADLHSRQRGGGQSLQLAIDLRARKVVRELAFQ